MGENLSKVRESLILRTKSYADITANICDPIENKASKNWYIFISLMAIIAMWGIANLLYLLGTGIGTWGLNNSIDWAWDITNFVWWVGIGHAGTLISAVLLLLRQRWRMAINRSAEAMTIFAVMMAGLFPVIHAGRTWLLYWVFPLPNQFGSLWPNFNSPLLWDVFAISTYFSVSLVFWYIGLIPDFATIRDRIKSPTAKRVYALLAFGWSGRAKHWHRFEMVSLILAGLATPLVFSVHSIVSMDFATSVVPGWHTTIFPPYFVAGAVFSGFAMVVTLMVPAREFFGLRELVTLRHLENMTKIILLTGTMVGYAYAMEFFTAWYSGNRYEQFAFMNRAFGPYAWAYWTMVTCNVISPQFFWFKKFRTTPWLMVIVCIFVNIGMWFERFVITVTSLSRDFLPSSWGYYQPTFVDIGMLIGSFGLFFTLFLLFCRYMPIVAISEVKSILPENQNPH